MNGEKTMKQQPSHDRKPAAPAAGARARASFMNRLLLAAVTAAVMLTVSCHERKTPNPGPAPAAGQPTGPGAAPVPASRPVRTQPASLILLYTTALMGEVTDCGCPHHPRGGLARHAHYSMGLKEARRDVVQVNGGDAFFQYLGANPVVNEGMKKKALAIAAASARMGVDAINVGKEDLMAGYAFLKDELEKGQGHEPLHLVSMPAAPRSASSDCSPRARPATPPSPRWTRWPPPRK
jgi:2',3'-cyclic-nucleotide 2'-phosphodiesterase (5'-nucleotidase family)